MEGPEQLLIDPTVAFLTGVFAGAILVLLLFLLGIATVS